MSNEPDRYDKLAETLFSGAMYPSPGHVAAALRQTADEAIDAAEAAFRKWGDDTRDTRDVFQVLADVRAAPSPAAAPAAGICGYSANGFGPCVLPRDHAGTHGGASEWAKQQGYAPLPAPVAPSLLPRVLAALEQDACAGNVSAHRLESLAAELRRYIASTAPQSREGEGK